MLAVLGSELAALAQTPEKTPVAEPPPLTESLTSFQPSLCRIEWSNQRWQLVAGRVVLKDFGRREREAREALQLIRELNLNQHGTIGQPAPVVEYWLSNGLAPRGPIRGHRVLPFEPSQLKLESANGEWHVADGNRTLFKFGPHEAEARHAIDILRKYEFNRLVIVGQAAPTMLVFLCDDSTTSHRPQRAPVIHRPGGSLAGVGKDRARNEGKDGTAKAEMVRTSATMPVTPVVAPLREGPRPPGGPRLAFAGGSVREFGRGRQMGAAPPPANVEKLADRVTFDWRAVEVRRQADGWALVAGEQVLAHLGERQAVAQQALEVVRFFRLNEQRVVGREPYFSYFLVDGRIPRGVPFGHDSRPFQTNSLLVRELEGQWCICDGHEPLLRFGDKREEATAFLQLLRQERIDRLLVLGPPTEGLTLLARSR
jgi:hypothetical protein